MFGLLNFGVRLGATVAPTVTSISRAVGYRLGSGLARTVTGTGFTGATGVTIDGVACTSVVVVNDTTITLVTPTITTEGFKNVVVTNTVGSGTLTSGYLALASAVWLDPTLASSLSLSGSDVLQINDLSSNVRNFAKDGASPTPTLASASLNGLDAMFSPAVGFLKGPSLSGLTAAEAFIVNKVAPAGTAGIPGLWAFGTPADSGYYPFSGTAIYDSFGQNTRPALAVPAGGLAGALESTNVFNVITSATEFTASVNGEQLYTTGTNTVAWRPDSYIFHNNFNAEFNGHIGELIIMPRKLTAPERAVVEADLTRWGVTFS